MNLEQKIKALDKSNMFLHLKNFPDQIMQSIEIAKKYRGFQNKNKKFVLLGMGGSAIAGDLLQTYFRNSPYNDIELFVNRNYYLLRKVDSNTNVIVSSYSGNTEETLEAYGYAKQFTQNIIGITSGGRLKEILSDDGFPVVEIPSGLQPREALGYSFFTLFLLILKPLLFDYDFQKTIEKLGNLMAFLNEKAEQYSKPQNNDAFDMALKLKDRIPIIYSTEETFFSVALRIKAQIQENAKQLCFIGVVPEMNHNEINSYVFPESMINNIKVLFLKDKNDHPKNKKRIEATKLILSKKIEVEEWESDKKDFLFRLFDAIYFFDWVSFYLAMENGVDPTPIPTIKELKDFMQR